MKTSTQKKQQPLVAKKIDILRMLWQRKQYYFAGFMLSFLIGVINLGMGTPIEISELITIPFSCSFILGFILYISIKEPDRLKKEGRQIIFSKEGLIHFGLTFGTMIGIGVILNLLKLIH